MGWASVQGRTGHNEGTHSTRSMPFLRVHTCLIVGQLMIQAVGSSPVPGQSFSNGTGSLQAQLAQAQAKLAACINCSTAKTPQGQAQIAALSIQVAALSAQIQAAQARQGPSSPAPTPVNPPNFSVGAVDLQA